MSDGEGNMSDPSYAAVASYTAIVDVGASAGPGRYGRSPLRCTWCCGIRCCSPTLTASGWRAAEKTIRRPGSAAATAVSAVSVLSWTSVSTAVGLFCFQLTHRVRHHQYHQQERHRGERSLGAVVGIYVGVVAATTVVVATAVRVADGLTEVVVTRGPGAAEAVELGNPIAVGGSVSLSSVGSGADLASRLMMEATAEVYVAEMVCRLAVIAVAIAAIPLVADRMLARTRPRWVGAGAAWGAPGDRDLKPVSQPWL